MRNRSFKLSALIFLFVAILPVGQVSAQSKDLMIGTDMMKTVLYFFNTSSDKMITHELSTDPLWPGGLPLHTIIVPDATKAYLSVMSSDKDPLTFVVLKIGAIDWSAGRADVKITKVIRVEEPGTAPSMLIPEKTDSSQPVTDLWKPTNQQLHGPTIHPNGKFVYFTQWTDNKIRIIDVVNDKLAAFDPVQNGTFTRQMHGVYFNPRGNIAIGTGYYFDLNYLTSYKVNPSTGELEFNGVITLMVDEKAKDYAAFSHFVIWLDNRYALTATQQNGPTSLTPQGFKVSGPSVWLIDALEGHAQRIIGPATRPEEAGIYKGASDLMLVGKKLYVAEEDSLDDQINDSYVSIWDFSNRHAPKFIRRLSPGHGLPEGFDLAHEFYPTRDGKYIYVQSWQSAHLVKLDTSSDAVVKVFSKEDGFMMPHGNFIPGNLR